MRRTKIVATVGPASSSDESILALIAAGVDVFRVNLSHGPIATNVARIVRLRELVRSTERIVAILADLPGPKIRAGKFPDGGVHASIGASFALRPGNGESNSTTIVVDYDSLLQDLAIGDRVTIGDGEITLVVDRCGDGEATAIVRTGGLLQGSPGVHLGTERQRLSAPTQEDLHYLEALREAPPDFVAVSFVREARDIHVVRDALGPNGPAIVAKIETRAAIDDLDAIVEAADAVMVARGDLGIECPLEEVPHLQKHIIRVCVEAGVPVITATQMLESMIESPQPTRAEVSDVANAVFDGTDAVMLSGETAIGAHPAGVVETMARIVAHAEGQAHYRGWGARVGRMQRARDTAGELRVTQAVSRAGWEAADEIGAAAIVCCTRSGRTARSMARFRPLARLVGVSPDDAVVRRLALSWGVTPISVSEQSSTDALVWHAVEATVKRGFAALGDYVLVLAGDPRSTGGATDVLRVIRIS